jgi:hypothetical protein
VEYLLFSGRVIDSEMRIRSEIDCGKTDEIDGKDVFKSANMLKQVLKQN